MIKKFRDEEIALLTSVEQSGHVSIGYYASRKVLDSLVRKGALVRSKIEYKALLFGYKYVVNKGLKE